MLVKLVTESEVRQRQTRSWKGKMEFCQLEGRTDSTHTLVVVLRRLVGASSTTWAWFFSAEIAHPRMMLQKLTVDSVEHLE